MKRFSCLFILVLFAGMVKSQSQLEKGMDELMKSYSGNHPGASLLIIENGEQKFRKSYGMAEIENGIPVSVSTNFRLASVTKQFTATCILKLAQRGLLNIHQTLDHYFNPFPEFGKLITIHHLLTHTSGIPDYEDFVPDSAMNPQVKDADVLQIILKTDNLYFQPGSEFRYSNTAYALLALIVEKVSGKKFGSFLKDEIFSPLGMNNTIAFEKGKNEVTNRAYGYDRETNGWTRKDQSSTSAVLGDGGIYSNVEDLYKWDQSLYSTLLLLSEMKKKMFSKAALNSGAAIPYGYGWHLKEWDGNNIVYHTGSSTSFRNILYRIPGRNFSIILLTNRNEPEEEAMVDIAEKIATLYYNNQAEPANTGN